MDNFFNPTDKAAIDALFRNVEGLKDNWWTGKNSLAKDIIAKDDDGNVVEIRLSYMNLTGSVHLTKLPPKLKILAFGSNELSGHLDLTQLPSSLEWLGLTYNSFTTIKIGNNLPISLKTLYVINNELRGVMLKPTAVEDLRTNGNEDLIVCDTQEKYDKVIARRTGCVRMLRAARSSTHNAHEAFKVWDVAQQTINFLVNDVSVE